MSRSERTDRSGRLEAPGRHPAREPGARRTPVAARKPPASRRIEAPEPAGTRKGTGVARAYQEVRDRIIHLELQPGEEIDETVFVRRLGLSRTPVRQALIRLQSDGLVEILPNHGARVASLDLAGVREFFEIFDVAQRMATRWAAVRRTDVDLHRIGAECRAFESSAGRGDVRAMMEANLRLHEAIGAACGNRLVARYYSQLLSLALRLSCLALVYETHGTVRSRAEHLREIVNDHREILDVITRGDADGAERLASRHAQLFRQRVGDYLANDLSRTIGLDDSPARGA